MMEDVLTPEEYALLLQLGADNSQLDDAVKMQMLQAEQLRTGAPQMRQAGRVNVAPNALELLGNLAQNKVSYDKQKQALAGRGQAAGNMNQQNQMLMQALLRGRGAPQPAPPGWPTQVDNNGAY